MLNKKFRLKRACAFNATYSNRDIESDSNICIYFGKNKTDKNIYTKIGFVVSKKIHKRAVVRNRIKRLMRESFRQILKNPDNIYIYNYISVICVAKSPCVNSDYASIDNSLRSLISRKAL